MSSSLISKEVPKSANWLFIYCNFRNISDRLEGEQTNQRAEIMVNSSLNTLEVGLLVTSLSLH